MKHVHADKMLLYAQDAQETEKPWVRWELAGSVNTWNAMQMHPAWLPLTMYRRIDEYRECREAQDRGETIEFHGTNGVGPQH